MFRKFVHRQSRRRVPSRGGSKLDPSMFIRKASGLVKEEPYLHSFVFQNLQINLNLKANILKKGYTNPTPIQDQTIFHVLEGKDVLGIANTGTGKTAAFLIPLIEKVLQNGRERVLILVPTREIATQIHDEFVGFSHNLRLFSTVCVGGMPIHRQMESLRRNPQFVIATPGRLKDLQERRSINLGTFTKVVLDEADRMVDMGFINDIKKLLAAIPPQRQSLFFSATLPREVQSLIHSFLRNPVTVSVKKQETAPNVDQDIIRVKFGENKMEVLINLLRQAHFTKVLIFGRTKRGVDRITHTLQDRGFTVAAIHGNKVQSKRQRALDAFKAHRIKILVATDVAARGLDIPNVSHVINFDAPETYEDYVHRIGRTGRVDKNGIALTFVD